MKLPPYVSEFKDRHGKLRYRYRRAGVAAYLKGNPGSAEFKASLSAARTASVADVPTIAPRHPVGTINDLLSRYLRSTTFNNAGADRQRVSLGILEAFRADYGNDLVANFKFNHIEAILRAKALKRRVGKRIVGGPGAARSLHKQLKRLFAYAAKAEMIATNPAEQAEGLNASSGSHHTWNEDEIAAYRARHPLGTKARLAMEILLWTAMRRADACLFGPEHLKDNKIEFTAGKGKKVMKLPAAPQLITAIRMMPAVGIKTFLVTSFGKPFSNDGFGNWFVDRCTEAGLPARCRAHGLRKAIARRAAELESTQLQIKAIGGWSQDAEVTTYTAAADQAKLADTAIMRISDWDKGQCDD